MGGPLNIRNNNPGNIRRTDINWLGEVENWNGPFEKFETMEHGIRATMKVLKRYKYAYGHRSVIAVIGRWAPPSDNNPTAKYAEFVAKYMDVAPDELIDIEDYSTARKLVEAITLFEGGLRKLPYTEATLNRGLAMAGVKPAAKSKAMESRTVKSNAGAVVATVTTGVGVAATTVEQAKEIATTVGIVDYLPWIILVAAIAAIAFNFNAIRTRVEDMIHGRN